MIEFHDITSALMLRVVREGWLDDPEQNFKLGFPKGLAGQIAAREWIDDNADKLIGVYSDSEPVGMFHVEDQGNRTARFSTLFAPGKWGLMQKDAVLLLVETLMRDGYHRVESYPLASNVNAWKPLRRDCGFWEEGKLRDFLWIGDVPRDVLVLSMVKQQWKNFRKRKRKERNNADARTSTAPGIARSPDASEGRRQSAGGSA